MKKLKSLNELGIPIQLNYNYINIKDNNIVVEAVNICSLFNQGKRSTCVITKNVLTKETVVYTLFDFAYSFAEYNDIIEEVIVDENNKIVSPEATHDNYNFK